jgi:hypothetical protein
MPLVRYNYIEQMQAVHGICCSVPALEHKLEVQISCVFDGFVEDQLVHVTLGRHSGKSVPRRIYYKKSP